MHLSIPTALNQWMLILRKQFCGTRFLRESFILGCQVCNGRLEQYSFEKATLEPDFHAKFEFWEARSGTGEWGPERYSFEKAILWNQIFMQKLNFWMLGLGLGSGRPERYSFEKTTLQTKIPFPCKT